VITSAAVRPRALWAIGRAAADRDPMAGASTPAASPTKVLPMAGLATIALITANSLREESAARLQAWKLCWETHGAVTVPGISGSTARQRAATGNRREART
jgi:hypothetical protein